MQEISMSTVSRAISNRMPSGQKYTRKKITKLARERFTPNNIFYTQLFINYLSSKDPTKLKFFDEAGIKIPEVGTRTYGHSVKGTRSVEIICKQKSPNNTLNLLVSLDGPEYYNILSGATNTARFLAFFEEAGAAVNVNTGRPCLEVGDIVVMDNLSSHHYEGGEILEEWFDTMGIELLHTPSYHRLRIHRCATRYTSHMISLSHELRHFHTHFWQVHSFEFQYKCITEKCILPFYKRPGQKHNFICCLKCAG